MGLMWGSVVGQLGGGCGADVGQGYGAVGGLLWGGAVGQVGGCCGAALWGGWGRCGAAVGQRCGTSSQVYGAIWGLMALPNISMGPPHTCGSGRLEELSNLILFTSIGLYLSFMGFHCVFMGLYGFLWPCPTYLWVRPTLVGLGWV